MHSINIVFIVLISLSIIIQACGSKPEPTHVSVPQETAPSPSTKPAWEEEWEAILNAARKEGKVNVYTTYGADWRVAMSETMLKKYGIAFNALPGRADELMTRIWIEQQNKLYQADAIQAISGKRYFIESEQLVGILQPLEKMLILPEVVDPKVWVRGELPWVDQDTKNLFFWRDYLAVPIIINTDLVAPQEMQSWNDLLHPKWKGRIILSDPTIGGAANSVMTMLAWSIKDWDFIHHLLKQEPTIQRDYRLMTEWVARGKYAIMIGPRKEQVQIFIDMGAPIKYVNFHDGVITTFGAGTIAVLKGSPHPNTAKVFINFLLSKEGQTLTAKAGGFPSARVDVPTDFLDAAVLRQPGMKAFSTDDKYYLKKVEEINRKLKEIFEVYLKK